MRAREARRQFLPFCRQVEDAVLCFDGLAEYQLGLFSQVDRAARIAQGVVAGLGLLQLVLQLGQLLVQERQGFLGLRGLAIRVLPDVLLADFIEHGGGQGRIGSLQGDADDVRLAAALENAHPGLKGGDGFEAGFARHREVRFRLCPQRADPHFDHTAWSLEALQPADQAFETQAMHAVDQFIGAVPQRHHAQLLADEILRHVDAIDLYARVAPGVVAGEGVQ